MKTTKICFTIIVNVTSADYMAHVIGQAAVCLEIDLTLLSSHFCSITSSYAAVFITAVQLIVLQVGAIPDLAVRPYEF